MKLLIDFGNTRLKWALLGGGGLRPGGVFAHRDRNLEAALHIEGPERARIDAVLVASVVDDAREAELAALVQARFRVRAQFLRSPAQGLGIRNAYAEPARLGIDRFLGLAALQAARPQAQVLASVGTALTLDALDPAGNHLGGIIVPGLALMRGAVHARTARTRQPGGCFRELPSNTADGVFAGAVFAAAGAIDRFREVAARRLGTMPALFLTGGGVDELMPLLEDAVRMHDLVLRGLALWAESTVQAG
ncbi:type III pantothenate kinase [Dokdonella sp.]|uniref:type III pantothenate kinase n=1 Tax=Dokdonella sp. TaxID=2291710 RepID=UPI0031CB3EC7|nr:type III pantothenate kinase [Dokdonella sp.]